jgi:hypothetical protein
MRAVQSGPQPGMPEFNDQPFSGWSRRLLAVGQVAAFQVWRNDRAANDPRFDRSRANRSGAAKAGPPRPRPSAEFSEVLKRGESSGSQVKLVSLHSDFDRLSIHATIRGRQYQYVYRMVSASNAASLVEGFACPGFSRYRSARLLRPSCSRSQRQALFNRSTSLCRSTSR